MDTITEVKNLFERLAEAKPQPFPPAKSIVNVTDKHGVYIIYNAKGKVLHVGKTNRGKSGLNQRLQNHLYGSSSFAINYLKPKNIDLREGYQFAYIEEANAQIRAYLEALAAGSLCPAYIGTGESREK